MMSVIVADRLGEIAVGELEAPSDDRVPAGALSADPALFDMYLSALDLVLAEPEIISAFDDFGLSAATLRMKMVSEASNLLGAVPQEYAAYKAVADRELGVNGTDPGLMQNIEDINRTLRPVWVITAAVGMLMAAGGGASWGL
jgi:hypothetical protein